MTAVDVSPDALALAAENAATHDVRIDLRQSDLLAAVQGERFDLVLANLPYVGEGEAVDPEVESFEPALAVYAPDSGRALIERLIAEVPAVLAPGGLVGLELGAGQAPWAVEQLGRAGLDDAVSEPDLAGVERLAFAYRRATTTSPA